MEKQPQDNDSRKIPSAPDGPDGVTKKNGVYTWEMSVPLLTSKFFLADFAKLMAIAGGGLGLILVCIVIFSGDYDAIPGILLLSAVCTGGVALIFVFVVLAVFRNRVRLAYRVDSKGATTRMLDRRAKTGAKLAMILGAMAGKPGVAGSGLLASADEVRRVEYENVTRVNYHPKDRVIFLRPPYCFRPQRLFCPPDAYEEIAAVVARGVERGRKKQKEEAFGDREE